MITHTTSTHTHSDTHTHLSQSVHKFLLLRQGAFHHLESKKRGMCQRFRGRYSGIGEEATPLIQEGEELNREGSDRMSGGKSPPLQKHKIGIAAPMSTTVFN